ncbi:acyltransferase family protein [Novosphingobium sp. Leaf2]|uniref:acyltransferase family protein n=1 Tax=Novosphingobium sp. Leaf2 TaxID=1735670 RepID=UPI0006FFE21C|nr:acyltransferase [Novosphingobium sp. Leaf2]KQM22066.1 hypothetical protein ASE49_01805 [Novosphingobium sp. Leaf2]
MNTINPGMASIGAMIVSILLSLGLAHVVVGKSAEPVDRARLQAVDGLRFFLAIGVIFSHFPAHWAMASSGVWNAGVAPVFKGFGSSAVTVFFMITGFLFYGKLRRGHGLVDWKSLYVGRFLRLTPLYLIAVAMMFVIVFQLTGWTVRASLPQTIVSSVSWLTFTIPGDRAVNGYQNAQYVLAGAIWTLRFEWLFYAALPLGALLVRRLEDHHKWLIALLVVAAIGIAVMPDVGLNWFRPRRLSPFFFGMITYEMTRSQTITGMLRSPLASVVVLLALLASFTLGNEYNAPRFVLMFLVFAPIACGNSVFGVMCWPATRALGDASYSIYLLHGIVLTVLLTLLGTGRVATDTMMVWLWLPVACVASCALSLVTYRLIELPCMQLLRRPATKTLEVAP